MARPPDGPGEDASADDPPVAEPDAAAGHRSSEEARSDRIGKAEGGKADTDIAAGDLADDLADFA